MRIIMPLLVALLAVGLAVAMATGASNLVTTALAIPMGAITGFALTMRLFDDMPERREIARAKVRRRYADAMADPIVLTPQRRAPANDNGARRALPALPAPAIAA